jgi:hypothetical protein
MLISDATTTVAAGETGFVVQGLVREGRAEVKCPFRIMDLKWRAE